MCQHGYCGINFEIIVKYEIKPQCKGLFYEFDKNVSSL